MNETEKDMNDVHKALRRAQEYGLEVEVVLWAIYSMRRDPSQTVEEALADGLYEWDI